MPGIYRNTQQAGTWPNTKGQLVGCGQSGANLMSANTSPAGGKLGFIRALELLGVLGLTQCVMLCTDRDNSSR